MENRQVTFVWKIWRYWNLTIVNLGKCQKVCQKLRKCQWKLSIA